MEHALHSIQFSPHHAVHHKLHPDQCDRCLSFSSADIYTPDSTPVCSDSSDDEEEDFQMVALDDEHWISKKIPKRTLCIHEHGLPHGLC